MTTQIPIVITGFGPFGGVPDNPSSTLVKAITTTHNSTRNFHVLESAILDTSIEGATELSRLQNLNACFHLHLGVHGGATEIHVESQAFNQDDFRIPDNNGNQPRSSVIATECPSIYKSSVDVKKLVESLGAGFCVSDDPGRFLCNHVFFQSLRWCATRSAGDRHCLFVHVPPFEVVPENVQTTLIIKLLDTLCGAFSEYASGTPISMDSTSEQEKTFAPSVSVSSSSSSSSSSSGEVKLNDVERSSSSATPSIPQAVLDFGFDRNQILQAISLLPNQFKEDPQRIIECIMTMSSNDGSGFDFAAADAAAAVPLDEHKMVLLVRKDLNMGVGKIAAQCCHAAVGACRANDFQEWRNQGEAKIVLAVKNQAELMKYCTAARAAGLPTYEIQDAGRTEVAPGTMTCAAIGPARKVLIDAVTGKLRLLK